MRYSYGGRILVTRPCKVVNSRPRDRLRPKLAKFVSAILLVQLFPHPRLLQPTFQRLFSIYRFDMEKSPLSQLPGELRNRIWEFAAYQPSDIHLVTAEGYRLALRDPDKFIAGNGQNKRNECHMLVSSVNMPCVTGNRSMRY